MKIVTVEKMRAIEKAADASGLTYELMMENAGRAVAEAIQEYWPDLRGMNVLILVGTGNNGGDGLVAGHHLAQVGAEVSAYLTRERTEEDVNYSRLTKRASQITSVERDQNWQALRKMVKDADMILDAVLGTGFQLPLKGVAKDLLGKVKNELQLRDRSPVVVAVDCPSGLDCDTGQITEETLACDLTVTLAAAKPGLLTFPGANAVGRLVVADIGIKADQKEFADVDLELATSDVLKRWLPARPKDAHKGTFGRALIVAGSVNFPGAVVLAGLGAYRVGAGLVTLAVPAPIQAMLVPQLPEATWIVLPHEMGVIAEGAAVVLEEELETTQALLLGPGFGQDPATETFLERFLSMGAGISRGMIGFLHSEERERAPISLPPCVVDADGLKLLKRIPNWPDLLPKPSVLTPHPGEMAVLTDLSKDEIQENRVETAKTWAVRWGHVVVLKGAFTVIAAPDGRVSVLPFATPALARAGTGDVLAGAIVGFQAQGLAAYEAAVLGAYFHGRAGELAAEMMGSAASVLAGDVADGLIEVMAELSR
ncbi:MAG TPA: NAD(P)H-hydrate dehydratase [Anaerolineae bacterium]|nr:NAD(P)H-hydrate dehydratase [Anaerolineae bacterium]